MIKENYRSTYNSIQRRDQGLICGDSRCLSETFPVGELKSPNPKNRNLFLSWIVRPYHWNSGIIVIPNVIYLA